MGNVIDAALIGDRDLPGTDHLVDVEHVLPDGGHDSGGGHIVSARPHPCGDSLFLQRLHSCEETGNRFHRRIDPECADDGRNSGADDLAQEHLWRLARETSLSTTAKEML